MSPEENPVGGSVSGGSDDLGAWAVRSTFLPSADGTPWVDEIEGGFGTEGDAMLHGFYSSMHLDGFNLAGVAIGRLGAGTWRPLDMAAASKPARTEAPESDLYRPCEGDRVMDRRPQTWGRTGEVVGVQHSGEALPVVVRPDEYGMEGRAVFSCTPPELLRLAESGP